MFVWTCAWSSCFLSGFELSLTRSGLLWLLDVVVSQGARRSCYPSISFDPRVGGCGMIPTLILVSCLHLSDIKVGEGGTTCGHPRKKFRFQNLSWRGNYRGFGAVGNMTPMWGRFGEGVGDGCKLRSAYMGAYVVVQFNDNVRHFTWSRCMACHLRHRLWWCQRTYGLRKKLRVAPQRVCLVRDVYKSGTNTNGHSIWCFLAYRVGH